MNDNIKIIIPARYGSKGAPFKNRRLIQYTVDAALEITCDKNIYISTDDDAIKDVYVGQLHIIDRPYEFATDEASVKDVILHAKGIIKPSDDTLLVVLYPTYPLRTREHIEDAIAFFKKHKAKSLLCKKEYRGVSPYLMMFPVDGDKGSQVVTHNLYRRQDYPPVFEVCHYIIVMRADELEKLNNNLYNEDTLFFPIDNGFVKIIDVDDEKDIKAFWELHATLKAICKKDGI
jgi:CMP-N,N'-diacetyllegionaminic acid synthase